MVVSPRPVTVERIYRRLRAMFIMQSIMFALILIGMFILLGNQQQTFLYISAATSEVESANKKIDNKINIIKETIGVGAERTTSAPNTEDVKLDPSKVKK